MIVCRMKSGLQFKYIYIQVADIAIISYGISTKENFD